MRRLGTEHPKLFFMLLSFVAGACRVKKIKSLGISQDLNS
jgi:hypothetical protein